MAISLILLISLQIISIGCSSGNSEPQLTISETPTASIISPPTPSPTYDLPESHYMPEIARISIHELKDKVDAGARIAIVDSRERKYFDIAHIVNAISIPYNEENPSYEKLAGYDEIVTYCS